MALIIISVGAGSEPAPTDNDSPPLKRGARADLKEYPHFLYLNQAVRAMLIINEDTSISRICSLKK
jgi:hypothetical protein